jgi:Flp pilus assembly protein TadB
MKDIATLMLIALLALVMIGILVIVHGILNWWGLAIAAGAVVIYLNTKRGRRHLGLK